MCLEQAALVVILLLLSLPAAAPTLSPHFVPPAVPPPSSPPTAPPPPELHLASPLTEGNNYLQVLGLGNYSTMIKVVNDIFLFQAYTNHVIALKNADVPIHGMGIQSHLHNVPDPELTMVGVLLLIFFLKHTQNKTNLLLCEKG